MMAKKDELYKKQLDKIMPFKFDQTIADAFDDMAGRSIPFYHNLQVFVAGMVKQYYQAGTVIYDLGCSTGNTVLAVDREMESPYHLVAVDKSAEMIDIARRKCQALQSIDWQINGIEDIDFNNASVINVSYVLQFINPDNRAALIKKMYCGLQKGGVLILSEKICCDDPDLNVLMINQYDKFKQAQGYSELEIQQKKEALKSILIPFSLSKYEDIIQQTGFSYYHIIFKYMNFVSLVAFK